MQLARTRRGGGALSNLSKNFTIDCVSREVIIVLIDVVLEEYVAPFNPFGALTFNVWFIQFV